MRNRANTDRGVYPFLGPPTAMLVVAEISFLVTTLARANVGKSTRTKHGEIFWHSVYYP